MSDEPASPGAGAPPVVPSLANVVLGESSSDGVLASIALARRLPGGASLLFAPRAGLAAALTIPAHRERKQPYRLHVVGPDLAPETRAPTLATLRADPKRSLHWYDANLWTAEDAGEIRGLTEAAGGTWFNVPETHHAFPAIDAAAERMSLAADPFAETLRALAERRLPDADEAEWGRAWRDTLETLGDHPLAIPGSVKPLLHGMPAELAPLDRGEGEALRAEIDHLFGATNILKVPCRGVGGECAALLVLPSSKHQPAVPMALEAIAKTGCDLAVVLFDRTHHAVLVGRRHGAEPPVEVRAPFDRMLSLPFVRRDRLLPGFGQVALVDPPRDALERLVAALL